MGACVITAAVFFFGFCGFLAAWSQLWVPVNAEDDGNTALFSLLNTVDGYQHIWVIVVCSILSVTMSTSAVDSLQNAIVDNVASVYLKVRTLLYHSASHPGACSCAAPVLRCASVPLELLYNCMQLHGRRWAGV